MYWSGQILPSGIIDQDGEFELKFHNLHFGETSEENPCLSL